MLWLDDVSDVISCSTDSLKGLWPAPAGTPGCPERGELGVAKCIGTVLGKADLLHGRAACRLEQKAVAMAKEETPAVADALFSGQRLRAPTIEAGGTYD